MTTEFFLPDEHELLRAWFNHSSISPQVDQILLDSGFDQYCEPYTRLSAAIGATVVRNIQGRLPNFGVGLPDGAIALTRKINPTSAQSARLSPQHLFTVNWADTAPGISWPVAYHACWLPTFGRFVVTSSADSPEAFGYCDFALGHFGHDGEWRESVKAILVADWRAQTEKRGQGPWAYVAQAGVLPEDTANAWKEEVWSGPCKAGSLADAVLAFAAARSGRAHPSGGNTGVDAIPPKPKDDPLFRRVFVVGLSFPRRSFCPQDNAGNVSSKHRRARDVL